MSSALAPRLARVLAIVRKPTKISFVFNLNPNQVENECVFNLLFNKVKNIMKNSCVFNPYRDMGRLKTPGQKQPFLTFTPVFHLL